jgi:hypothetical protein
MVKNSFPNQLAVDENPSRRFPRIGCLFFSSSELTIEGTHIGLSPRTVAKASGIIYFMQQALNSANNRKELIHER